MSDKFIKKAYTLLELSNTNNTLSEKYLFFIHLNRVVINKYYFEFLPLFRGIQLYKPTSSPVKSQIANDLTWPWSDQRVFSFSNLEGHHFDNREAPWDEAGMKRSQQSEQKRVIKQITLSIAVKISLLFFLSNISQARLDFSDSFRE